MSEGAWLMTRTHTRYFDDEHLGALSAAVDELCADWQGRESFMAPDAYAAGSRRLKVLVAALDLLGEPVAGSFT